MKQYTLDDIFDIMKVLRGENGCPWDRVQTHESIRKNLIEEAYEAADAMDKDDKAFANELGDVLLQVIFHACIASDRGAFTFDDILNELGNKLVSRHSHIFGNDTAVDAEQALARWEENKRKEKGLESPAQMFDDIPKHMPALMRAEKVQKKMASVGFLQNDAEEYMNIIKSNVGKLENAVNENQPVEENIGEILFMLAGFARKMGVNAEELLSKTTSKYVEKYKNSEKH